MYRIQSYVSFQTSDLRSITTGTKFNFTGFNISLLAVTQPSLNSNYSNTLLLLLLNEKDNCASPSPWARESKDVTKLHVDAVDIMGVIEADIASSNHRRKCHSMNVFCEAFTSL